MVQNKADYLSNLDMLRFLAALWVVATHYGHVGPAMLEVGYGVPDGIFFPILKYGYLGVPIFFCLSGFLIAHVSANTDAVRFGANRVLRLMPGFWVSMTVTAIIIAVLGTPNGISVGQWAANIALAPGAFGYGFVDGVYWTLQFEFIFYGWAAILLLAGIFHRRILAICSAWLAIVALNQFVLFSGPMERLFLTEYATAFIVGMVFWYVRHHGWSWLPVVLVALSTLMLGEALVEHDRQAFLVIKPESFGLTAAIITAALVFACVYACIFLPQIQRGRKTLMLLGGVSYPLYLIHQEIGYAIFRQLDGKVPALPMVLVTTLGVIALAWAIHVYAEGPLRRLLQKLFNPLVGFVADGVEAVRGRILPHKAPAAAE